MPIRKKKISDLTLADSLKGLFTIGYKVVDGVKISVRMSLEYIQVAYQGVVKATQDAVKATADVRQLEDTVEENEKRRVTGESQRESSEQGRQTSETARGTAEAKRATAETGRVNAEKTRVTEFGKLKTASEKSTNDAIAATGKTNEAIHNAEVATGEAQVATASANQAAIGANQSATNADGKAALANTAAASANDTANHPTYIGTDHYVYKWNKTTKAYDKTDIYCKGDAFSVKKVYASVAALNADVNNASIKEGDFVLVNTNNVENPDNAKLYVKAKAGSVYSYEFLVDMSGAIGFTGKTPQFLMGSISTLGAGGTATATVSEDGTDSAGNPKYKINFAIPRGNPGAPFRVAGEYATLDALLFAVPDGSNVDGFMAIGTKVPYNYYAWVNGNWKDQGKIGSGNDDIPIGDMRISASLRSNYGEKYVMCNGQNVSAEDYPDVETFLPFELNSTIEKSFPTVAAPAMVVNRMITAVSDGAALMLQTTIEMIGDLPDAKSATVHVYKSYGGDWTYLGVLPKTEGSGLMIDKAFILRGKAFLFGIEVSSLEDAEQGKGTEKIYVTSDLENFQDWEVVEPVAPDSTPGIYTLLSIAYGKGVYAAVFNCQYSDGQYGYFFARSTDLVHWSNLDSALPGWVKSDNEMSVAAVCFDADAWIIQIGDGIFVGQDINVDSPTSTFTGVNVFASSGLADPILSFQYLRAAYLEGYVGVTKSTQFTIQRTYGSTDNFDLSTPPKPSNFDTDEKVVYISGNGSLVGSKGHYQSLGGQQGYLNIPDNHRYVERVIRCGNNLLWHASLEFKYLIIPINYKVPFLNSDGGLCVFIKLK